MLAPGSPAEAESMSIKSAADTASTTTTSSRSSLDSEDSMNSRSLSPSEMPVHVEEGYPEFIGVEDKGARRMNDHGDTPPILDSNHTYPVGTLMSRYQREVNSTADPTISTATSTDTNDEGAVRYLYPTVYEDIGQLQYQLYHEEPTVLCPGPQRLLSMRPQPQQHKPLVKIDVPFLVNYDDILTYGRQRLPTLLEEDEDDDEDETGVEQEARSSPPKEEQTFSNVECDDSRSCYSFVDYYPDHRWDAIHGDDVLSDAMYYHVLEVEHAQHASPPQIPMMHLPSPVRTTPPPPLPFGANLVRPQALRVVCPTTIAPVFRQDEDVDGSPSSGPTDGKSSYLSWYQSYLDVEGEAPFRQALE